MKKIFFLVSLATATGAFAQIPNPSFETWNSHNSEKIKDWWVTGDVVKSTAAHSGTASLRLNVDNSNTGIISLTQTYTGRPNQFHVWLRGWHTNDTAVFVVSMHKDGNIISFNIYKAALTDSVNYKEYIFNLDYSDSSNADTSRVSVYGGLQNGGGGHVLIDDLSFTKNGNPDGTILNNSFENWITHTTYSINGWFTTEDILNTNGLYLDSSLVSKSSDAAQGLFAVKLTTRDFQGDPFPAVIVTGDLNNVFGRGDDPDSVPVFPVSSRWGRMSLSVKVMPAIGDSARLYIGMFSGGKVVGQGIKRIGNTISTWQQMNVPINYLPTFSGMPDSACINLSASGFDNPVVGSVLYVDALSLTYNTGIENAFNYRFEIYPNPAKGLVYIESAEKNAMIYVYDAKGSLIHSSKASGIVSQLDISGFAKGIYLVKMNSDNGENSRKLIVE